MVAANHELLDVFRAACAAGRISAAFCCITTVPRAF